nr:hypothetical protein [Tanacetum cinerariifolium]
MEFIEKRRLFFAAKRAKEKSNKPPTKAQQRSIMCTYLKNIDGWKPKNLKTKSFAKIKKLFDTAMKRVNDFVAFKTELVEGNKEKKESKVVEDDGDDVTIDATPLSSSKLLKNFNREDLEVLWRIVKEIVEKTQPVHYMDNFILHNMKSMFEHHVKDNSIQMFPLVEKMYPLTNYTLQQMFNDVRLQVEHECEMAFKLLRLVRRQLREGYVLT